MSVGLRMKLDPKKVSALVQDVYIFLGKNRLSQEEFAYKVNLHVTTVKNLLNRNYCTKRTALMVCPIIGKQYSDYGFEEDGTVYDYQYLRENLISYLSKKDIKPTTFAIINKLDKDTVVGFVNGSDDFMTADRIEGICHGMGQSSSIYKVKTTSPKQSKKGARNPYDVDRIRADLIDMINQKGISNKSFATLYDIPVRTLADFLSETYDSTELGTLRNICLKTGLDLESYRKNKPKQKEKPKTEPVDITAIYQEVSKVMYGIMKETFEEFLKDNADKYIQKKKGWFK